MPDRLRDLDGVSTLVALTDPETGREWPAGTVGTIVDLRTDSAMVEIVDRETGRTPGFVDASLDDLQLVASPS